MNKNIRQSFLLILLAVIFASSLFPYQAVKTSAHENSPSSESTFFQVATANEDFLDIVATAPGYKIAQTERDGQIFNTIAVPGADQSTTAGQPELPIASTLIGVPPQAVVSLEISSDSSEKIAGKYQISEAPFPARIFEGNGSPDQWDYHWSDELKNLEDFRSENQFVAVRIAEEAWIRDQRIIRLEYSPIEYEANSGELRWHPLVNVRLKFDYPAGKTQTNIPKAESQVSDQPFEILLNDSLLNYDQAIPWRAFPDSTSALVTPPDVGSRYRIAVNEDGIYKLTYEELVAVNPTIAGANSQFLQMTSQGEDIAIHVEDSNGNFGPGDYILFYGQRFYGDHLADIYAAENAQYRAFIQQQTDGTYSLWKPEYNEIMLEKYTHENVYWLFVGTSNGLRMQTVNGDPSGNINAPVPYYRETVRAEESTQWKTTFFSGEDTWFWKAIQITEPFTTVLAPFTATVTAPASTGPQAIIRTEFVSSKQNSGLNFDHHTKVFFNGVEYGNFFWSGISRYTFEHSLTPASIQNGINTLTIEAYSDAEVALASYYFDWFEIEYNRLFEAENNTITFNSTETGTQKYQVIGFGTTNGLNILDISDPMVPVRVTNAVKTSNQVTISLTHLEPLTVTMAAGVKSIPSGKISYYAPPNWGTMTDGYDYVFITHPDFIDALQDLADYRTNSGFSTHIFNIEDIYNEFNFGIFNPIAIKNFLAFTFDQWQTPPKYALLVGDGHWNFHAYNPEDYGNPPQFLPPNLAWVDPWQGEVDSANLLATVVGEDPLADLIIARLPVNSSQEIDNYLTKLVNYEAPHISQDWERNHLFIADNADDAGNFPYFADDVIAQYIDPSPFANEIRIYQDDYGCSSSSSAECALVRNAITNTLNNTGALIVSYIGHASVARWSHERIFTPDQFPQLTNSSKLPVILSMTCLDGYWSGPSVYPGSSMIEEIVRKPDTGAIATFSPTGLGISTGHDILHKGFYDTLMNEGIWELGTATQNAKIDLFTVGIHPDLLHTYTIFGDPSLQIRNPFRFSASPAESLLFTDTPGTVLTHQIVVQNTGTQTDQYEIKIVSSNWATTTTIELTNPIPSGGQVTIPIQVQTDNPGFGSDTAIVTVTSVGDRSLIFESRLISQIVFEIHHLFLPITKK